MTIVLLTTVVSVKHVQLYCSDSEDSIQLWSVVVSQHEAATGLSLSSSASDTETCLYQAHTHCKVQI